MVINRPRVIKEQMTVGDGQLKVEIYPEKKPPTSNGVDTQANHFILVNVFSTTVLMKHYKIFIISTK